MTDAERAHKYRKERKQGLLNAVNDAADMILTKLDCMVYDEATSAQEEKDDLEYNRKLVKDLIAAARKLGRDRSNVI